LLRYALLQGPWQSWLVRRYQRTSRVTPIPVASETLFPSINVAHALQDLAKSAIAHGFQLPDAMVEETVRFVTAEGARRIDQPHHRCVPVSRIAHDPAIVAVAREFLGAEPILLETKIFWTLPMPDASGRMMGAAEGGLFHYDVVDIRALTVFVYLTDVDLDCGPHVVIPGTHTRRTPDQILRCNLSDGEAWKRYGARFEVITGPRGTGWFEDLTCYHKQAIGSKPRLMLSILYALHRTPPAVRPASYGTR
jgi:hypothetical protein